MRTWTSFALAALALVGSANAGPRRIQGVNLGGWLIFESWMAPDRWSDMGGESCDVCEDCAASEYTLVQKLGQTKANKVFNEHWTSWFTQDDVDEMVCLGLNAVRIPVGWWMIEELKSSTDYFPTGQLAQLKRGLKMLKKAGIWVLLDIHANPEVQSANQQFTGWCRSDVGFYTTANYKKSLRASAVFASLIHSDADFSMVFGLQAVNEPETNPELTPGLGQYYKDFVTMVRSVEQWHGMRCPTTETTGTMASNLDSTTKKLMAKYWKKVGVKPRTYDKVTNASSRRTLTGSNECIYNTFMSATWQWGDPTANLPSESAQGINFYDHHLYYSFGGVADATPDAYMRHICGLQRFREAAAYYGESQSLAFLGEWWLAAQWTGTSSSVNKTFYQAFGDAQKMMYYGQSKGWFFWSWKVENTGEFGYTRDYRQAVANNIMTKDPDDYFFPDVCQQYWDEWSGNSKRSEIAEFPMEGIPQLGNQFGAMPMAGDTLLSWDQQP